MERVFARQSRSTLVALASCVALQITGFAMLVPLFARRFESFGAGVRALGASEMAFALTGIVAAPLIGLLADRFGRRPIILISLAGHVLVFSGYILAGSAWMLISLRGMGGVFTAGLWPAVMSSAGDLAPGDRRAQWLGIVMGSSGGGYIVGPLLGGLLYDELGYVAPFTVAAAAALAALVVAGLRVPETSAPTPHAAHRRSSWRQAWQALPARPAFILLMLITGGVTFAWMFVGPQFMFYAYDDLSWTSVDMGLAMSAYAVTFMAGEFALGQLSDRLGRKPVLLLGLALFSAQFVGLVMFHDLPWIVASFTLAGLGNALYDPALGAMILDITPTEHTGSMMGLKSTAGSIGNLLGPALVTILTPSVGPQAIFFMAAALVAMLVVVSGLALRLPGRVQVSPHLSQVTVEG
jgi:MFS transporter, DHA1 family, multidrug resistance protein